MMRLLGVLLLSSATCFGQQSLDFLARAPQEYFVFQSGQSNANGKGTSPATYDLTGVIPYALIDWTNPNTGYLPLEYNVTNQAGANQFGPELSLGKYLGEALHQNIYIGKYAVDGAGLAAMAGKVDFSPTTGEEFPNLVDRILQAYGHLPVSELTYKKVFIWIQGETDGQGESGTPLIYSAEYQTNFESFIIALEDSIGFSFDQIIIGHLSENQRLGYYSTAEGFDDVVVKQKALIADDRRIWGVDTDNFATKAGDPAHYSGSGQNDYGVALAKTILGEYIAPVDADPSYAPTQYDGLKLWLDGSFGVTLTSDKVSQWDDRSGNNYHATQSSAGSRPNYNDTDDRIVLNADSFLDMSAWIDNFKNDTQGEIIVVMERTNTVAPNTDYLVSFSNPTNNTNYFSEYIRASASSSPDRVWINKINSAGNDVMNPDAAVAGANIIFSVANDSEKFKLWQDDATHETQLTATQGGVTEPNWIGNFPLPLTHFTIGGLQILAGNFLAKAEIRHVVYFDRQLKYEERLALFEYLTN